MKISISMEIDGRNASDVRAAKEIIEEVGKKGIKLAYENGCEGRPDEGLPYTSKHIIPENFLGLHEVLR